MSPKCPLQCFDILQQFDVKKITKGSPFYIFRHYATYRRLQKKFEENFLKIVSSIFGFWEVLLSPVVGKVVFESHGYPLMYNLAL